MKKESPFDSTPYLGQEPRSNRHRRISLHICFSCFKTFRPKRRDRYKYCGRGCYFAARKKDAQLRAQTLDANELDIPIMDEQEIIEMNRKVLDLES